MESTSEAMHRVTIQNDLKSIREAKEKGEQCNAARIVAASLLASQRYRNLFDRTEFSENPLSEDEVSLRGELEIFRQDEPEPWEASLEPGDIPDDDAILKSAQEGYVIDDKAIHESAEMSEAWKESLN